MESNEELDKRDVSKSHDQYCQYENLPRLLKRFSFSEKMRIASFYSSKIISLGDDVRKMNRDCALPWYLETFVMLSMEAVEYKDNDFTGRTFEKMYNSILDAAPKALKTTCDGSNLIDKLLPLSGMTQFHMQEQSWFRRYRYWTIFNDESNPVCMKEIFLDKFGTSYQEFLLLAYLLQLLFYAQMKDNSTLTYSGVFRYLVCERFAKAASQLQIQRTEYIALQQKFAAGSENTYKYIYSLSPSHQYALVEEDGVIYIPLPHLINQNVTSSLMHRLTEGNNKLRDEIGTHVWVQR